MTDDELAAALGRIWTGIDLPQPIGTNGNGHGHEPDFDTPPIERIRGAVITTTQLKALPPASWLIDGLLQENSLAQIHGKPGAYKSFLVADWALCVAHGLGWQGKAVSAAPVLYVVAEGAAGMGGRITAWETHHARRLDTVVDPKPIWWLPLAVRLGSPEWAHALGAFAAELGAGLVIFDTRARCTVGLEENAAKDMGLVVANLDVARQACGACMLVVHHSSARRDTPRGSTVIEGAVDTEISIKEADGTVTVRLDKQKNGTGGAEWRFRPSTVDGSVVLQAVADDIESVTSSGHRMLETLRAIHIDEPVSFTRWHDAIPDISKRTFAYQLKALVTAAWITKTGTGASARYAPGSAPPPAVEPDF